LGLETKDIQCGIIREEKNMWIFYLLFSGKKAENPMLFFRLNQRSSMKVNDFSILFSEK
jgi:hypothetical protein